MTKDLTKLKRDYLNAHKNTPLEDLIFMRKRVENTIEEKKVKLNVFKDLIKEKQMAVLNKIE
jgi:hypothetical protein